MPATLTENGAGFMAELAASLDLGGSLESHGQVEELGPARITAAARLRVLGQELEQRGITDFEVIVDEAGYLVRGQLPPPAQTAGPTRTLGSLFKRKAPANGPDPYVIGGAWERRYSGSDLDRLNDEYRSRRTKIGMPEDYAVSQVLRVVGTYVETRNWVLTSVNRTCRLIVVTYRDATGQLGTSRQTYAALYPFAVRLHRGRSASS